MRSPPNPHYFEDLDLDSINRMRARQGLPPRKGPPYDVPAPDNYPFRGPLIASG